MNASWRRCAASPPGCSGRRASGLRLGRKQVNAAVGGVSHEEATDESRQLAAVRRGQRLQERDDVRLKSPSGVVHERATVVAQADENGSSVRRRTAASNQATTLGAFHQAADAGLVEIQQPAQLVDRRPAVPEHAEEPRLDDREIVFGGAALERPMNEERQLSQAVDVAEFSCHGSGGYLI
jgi:hypothetical protein